MRGPLRCQAGTNAGAATAAGATGAGFTAAALWWVRRRFGSLCFSSQTRSVSSEIATPTFASDSAINRMDAPARRSASSTSRYGSRSVKRRDRGRRPAAIKRSSACASLGRAALVALAVGGNPLVVAGPRAGSGGSSPGRTSGECGAKSGWRAGVAGGEND